MQRSEIKVLSKHKKEKVDEAYQEALGLLRKYRKALIIRPTGFGKSYMLAHLSREFDYCVYFYPRDVIRTETEEKYKGILNPDRITFLSYQGVTAYYKENKSPLMYDILSKYKRVLFVFDEVHFIGAIKWGAAIKKLLSDYPEAYICGATATPTRPDGSEYRYNIFDGHEVSRYTLCDAIDDHIYYNPLYVYSMSEVDLYIEEGKKKIRQSSISDARKSELVTQLDKYVVKTGIFINNAEIIRKNCDNEFKHYDYLKFMVFFPTYEILTNKLEQMESWFKEAFPEFNINIIIVGRKKEYYGNDKKIHTLKRRSGWVDIIVSIDMLSYGVHIKDVNCVLMLRNTCSDIIYLQQLGRALSIDNSASSIIFDFVGNLDRRQYYGAYGSRGRVIDIAGDKDEWEGFSKRIRSVDNTLFLREIDRIIDIDRSALEQKWVKAILFKHCPNPVAMMKLKLNSEEDLKKVVLRWRKILDPKGISKVDI